ncbi:MAG: autotransporter outer membrane beta-barrel domain-containing protein, partial [Chlamydiae bacterium]|nr:autotransporter outer membrane beta-barrel domain-containing protein [Chlamydiota bacterium]
SQSEISTLLDTMQPAIFKGLTLSQENNAIQIGQSLGYRFEDVLNKRLCNSSEKDFHLWIDGFGDFLQQKNVSFQGSQQIGYDTHTGAAVIGFDARLSSFYLGVLSGYSGSTTDWNKHRGKGTIDTVYGGLYASALGKLFYGNLSILGGWSHFSGNRTLLAADRIIVAKHHNGGAQLTSHLDTGLNFQIKGFTIRPFDAFDYICQTEGAYSEKGAGAFNLHVSKSNAIMLRNELGLQFSKCFSFQTHLISISPKISWVRELRVKGKTYQASLNDSLCDFTVTGYFPDRSLVSPGIMLSGSVFNNFMSFDLYYNGQYGSNYNNTNYGGQLRYGF